MARKSSRVSLKPISTEIKRAVSKLKGLRPKVSRVDKKILSLKIHKLNRMNQSLYLLCKKGFSFMDAGAVAKLLRRPIRPHR